MEAIEQAIKSVGMHTQDHKDASPPERLRYHQYCVSEQKCDYVDYKEFHGTAEGFVYKGADGILAPRHKRTGRLLFDDHPEALPVFEKCFTKDNLFREGVLERTVKFFTQNMNESSHGTIWNNYLVKTDRHCFEDIKFGLRHFCLKHNFGAYRSSLHHKIGSLSNKIVRRLLANDLRTKRNSRQKWIPSQTRGRKHRSKLSFKPFDTIDQLPTLCQFNSGVEEEEHISKIRDMVTNLLFSKCVYRSGQGDGPGLEDN